MFFLTPLAFLLAFLIPVIIAMYLLKLRRTEQVISSTYLWQRMVRDVEANAPWQRLRRNILLLLQLLVLITLILALTRPYNWTIGSNSQSIILIFDTSASMSATDLNPDQSNRLETAKENARLLISNLPQETHCTIISASDTTKVLISSSQDKRVLFQAIDNLYPHSGSSDLTSALELASAVSTRQPDTEIVIYSDGRVNLPERLAIQGHIRYIPIGVGNDNQAISIFTLEAGNNPDQMTAFIQVTNYADQPAQRRLTISADGTLVDVQEMDIPAHGQISIIKENIPIDTDIVEASLTENDALSLDDKAWAIGQVHENRAITLVSYGNRFLETALRLLPGVDLIVLPPEKWDKITATDLDTPQTTDLFVFDSYVPTTTLRTGNLLFIGPLTESPYFSILGSLETPLPQPVNSADPILRHVDLSDVNILDSANIPLPDWARSVLVDESSGAPLLFAGEIQGQRLAVITFNPSRSDLPLLVSYPILIANFVEWLLPGRIGEVPTQINPGETITFTPPPEITTLKITRPDGSSSNHEVQEGRIIYADTYQLGVYKVSWEADQSLAFSVNLFNPQESNILPVERLPLLNENLAPIENQPQQARQEWWHSIATLALALLVIEWLVYHRSTLSKIAYQLKNTAKQIF